MGRFPAKLGPTTPLTRSGSKIGIERTSNQLQRPIRIPLRDQILFDHQNYNLQSSHKSYPVQKTQKTYSATIKPRNPNYNLSFDFSATSRQNLAPRPDPMGQARKVVRHAPRISPGDQLEDHLVAIPWSRHKET